MRTANLDIELMTPMQINKDIAFNEAILKLDSFINIGVLSFVEQVPSSIKAGEKYIITTGMESGKICYKACDHQAPLIHRPAKNMVVFVVSEGSFFHFDGDIWHKISSMQI